MCINVIATCAIIYRIRENFRWIKISPSPGTFVLQKILRKKTFANTVKVAIFSMQSLTQDKNSCDKFSPMRMGGKNFYAYDINNFCAHCAVVGCIWP